MNHSSTLISIIAITTGLAFSTITVAEYTGPGANSAETNLANIVKNPVDDQEVRLEGHIVKKIGKERYLFSDGSNQVEIELDDDDLPKQGLNDKQKVVIYGEVDKHRKGFEIDVDRVELK